MSEYTKGNWWADGSDVNTVIDGITSTIADCLNPASIGRKDSKENARLISAAPDLLNALELFLAHDTEPEYAIWRHVHQVAHDAITKATGWAA